MGKMIKIDEMIEYLQGIRERFGNTCIYLRSGGVSWGAVALNRQAADEQRPYLFRILGWLEEERIRQDQKWGPQDHDNAGWMLILLEEMGELAKAILEADLPGAVIELIQIGAVAMAWLENAARNEALVEEVRARLASQRRAAG